MTQWRRGRKRLKLKETNKQKWRCKKNGLNVLIFEFIFVFIILLRFYSYRLVLYWVGAYCFGKFPENDWYFPNITNMKIRNLQLKLNKLLFAFIHLDIKKIDFHQAMSGIWKVAKYFQNDFSLTMYHDHGSPHLPVLTIS